MHNMATVCGMRKVTLTHCEAIAEQGLHPDFLLTQRRGTAKKFLASGGNNASRSVQT